jgi:endo-1,4-beta-D-glucanase Y
MRTQFTTLPFLLAFGLLSACSATSDFPDSSSNGYGETGGSTGDGSGGSADGSGGSQDGSGGSAQGTGGAQDGSGGTSSGWHGAVAPTITDAMLQNDYNNWKVRHVQDCGDGSSVVKHTASTVVSEGIAYGMLITVAMAERTLFDRFWKHYQGHLNNNGLMNWKVNVCGSTLEHGAATDAELDAAMALIQAHQRWPDGNYLAQAESLASKILQFETETCDGRATLKPGDGWGGCTDPGSRQRVNPSYFSPGYYRVFAKHFASQSARWNALIEGTYYLYPVLQNRKDGLVPDWSRYDGAYDQDDNYWYDACRTPWRIATDYAFSGEPRARAALERFTAWVNGRGGLPGAAQQKNSAFIGSFALAYIYDQAQFDNMVRAWLTGQMDDTPYYQNTLRLIYMLLAANKFPSAL